MRYLSLLFLALFQLAFAKSFYYKDWEISCDNTLTCRVAGYNLESEENLVSVLLVRKAGNFSMENAKLDFQLGTGEGINFHKRTIQLLINNINYGKVGLNENNGDVELSKSQTKALIQSLLQTSNIIFKDKETNTIWHLSDRGAKAVLLKMDDIQGRINTRTAIVKKGNASLKQLKKAPPIPVIIKEPVLPTSKVDKARLNNKLDEIINAIKKETPQDSEDAYCDGLYEEFLSSQRDIVQLSKTKILVSSGCWLAAYNLGLGYWIVNDKPPYSPQLITESGSDYENGIIYSTHKMRGLGDCWSSEERVWNGKTFVLSNKHTTGMCRGFAGGAWLFPSYVTRIKQKTQ